jgi:hypothetical protein
MLATYSSHPADLIFLTHDSQLTCQQTPSDAWWRKVFFLLSSHANIFNSFRTLSCKLRVKINNKFLVGMTAVYQDYSPSS